MCSILEWIKNHIILGKNLAKNLLWKVLALEANVQRFGFCSEGAQIRARSARKNFPPWAPRSGEGDRRDGGADSRTTFIFYIRPKLGHFQEDLTIKKYLPPPLIAQQGDFFMFPSLNLSEWGQNSGPLIFPLFPLLYAYILDAPKGARCTSKDLQNHVSGNSGGKGEEYKM